MALERFTDWPQRLSAECDAWKDRPHDWDGSDCATFAGDCVLAMTGKDLLEGIRGRYTTPRGAARVIKSEGFDSLEQFVESLLSPCEPIRCGRGDVVICDGDEGEFLGVVVGTFAVAPHANGLVQVHLKFAKKGFKV